MRALQGDRARRLLQAHRPFDALERRQHALIGAGDTRRSMWISVIWQWVFFLPLASKRASCSASSSASGLAVRGYGKHFPV